MSLKTPFLRFCDDYLLFAKTENDLKNILSKIISPVLNELNLSLSPKKLKSGKFHKDKCVFLGFEFFSGYTRISEEKIIDFQKRIIGLTRLTKKKPVPAVIKLLNNQILGFGHYYKFASCQKIFKDLDAFLSFRGRRYILRNRDLLSKTGNLLLFNRVLKELGLKSLVENKQTFHQKFGKKIQKTRQIPSKTGKEKLCSKPLKSEEISQKYTQNQILKRLTELTRLVEKLERKISKIEKKLEQAKGLKKSKKTVLLRIYNFLKRAKD